jgi:hypothetical protein
VRSGCRDDAGSAKFRDQGSGIRDQGSGIRDQGSAMEDAPFSEDRLNCVVDAAKMIRGHHVKRTSQINLRSQSPSPINNR